LKAFYAPLQDTAMSSLKITPGEPDSAGRVIHVTPDNAGWSYVGFDLHRLAPGSVARGATGAREVCLVLISGRAAVAAAGDDFGTLGERMSPFNGKPWSVYAPRGADWLVTAETETVLAVCSAPGDAANGAARLIRPDSMHQETRGKGSNVRHVTNILPEWEPAASLLVVEVITPGGNASSYPPHKHDRDALPQESLLEETYYHRINPPQGYAFQRVYTEDGSLDETMTVADGDVTLVPRGYHPCAALHGYDLYYLNVMAGPKRIWRFYNQPQHAWLLKA
jgi:5-deoxy-glucuronate isomerase